MNSLYNIFLFKVHVVGVGIQIFLCIRAKVAKVTYYPLYYISPYSISPFYLKYKKLLEKKLTTRANISKYYISSFTSNVLELGYIYQLLCISINMMEFSFHWKCYKIKLHPKLVEPWNQGKYSIWSGVYDIIKRGKWNESFLCIFKSQL